MPRHPGEYLAIILLATVGLMLLVGSEELLMIFIGLELLGLSLYVMAAFDKTDARSAEAGLKYFLFGSTSSAFTLFGISLIYGMSGATGLAAISTKLATTSVQPLLAVGIVMTLVGFAFKIAAAPFHLWAPDAYQGAPVPSAAFIASGSKVASFVVLGRIVLVGFAPVHGSANWHAMAAGWSPVLAILSALSILVGNLVALAQQNVRRLLAYSAVALFGSLISLYYYLIVLKVIFVDASSSITAGPLEALPSDLLQQITIGVLAALILLLGIMPNALAGRILAAMP